MGFRIVWKPALRQAAPGTGDCNAANGGPPLAPAAEQPQCHGPVTVDRRDPRSQATFRGHDRRKRFGRNAGGVGKSAVILAKENILITLDEARFGDLAFKVADLQRVEVTTKEGESSLSWLLYGLLAALAVVQAVVDAQVELAAVAAVLVLLTCLAWPRRRSPDVYALLVSTARESVQVHRSVNWADVALLRDALATAMPAPIAEATKGGSDHLPRTSEALAA
jgi:hypothetical protein